MDAANSNYEKIRYGILAETARYIVKNSLPVPTKQLMLMIYLVDREHIVNTGTPLTWAGFKFLSNPLLENMIGKTDTWRKEVAERLGNCVAAHTGDYLELSRSNMDYINRGIKAYGSMRFDELCKYAKEHCAELDFVTSESRVVTLEDVLKCERFSEEKIKIIVNHYNEQTDLYKIKSDLR